MSDDKIKELEDKLSQALESNQKLDERAKNFEGQFTDLQKKLQVFEGVDLDALKAAKEENEILRRQAAGVDEDKFQQTIDEALGKERAEWQKSKEELEGKLSAAINENTRFKIDSQAWKHLEGVKDDMKPFVQGLIEKHVIIEGDQLVCVDENRKPMFSKQEVDKPKPWAEYAAELPSIYPSAFSTGAPATNKSDGTRSPSSNNGVSLVERLQNPEAAAKMSAKEKSEAGLEIARRNRV